jgi:hypothetical protein
MTGAGAPEGIDRPGGMDMSTMSTDLRRRRRLSAATFGVTIITIALVVIVVQLVGHQAGDLYAKVSTGLSL